MGKVIIKIIGIITKIQKNKYNTKLHITTDSPFDNSLIYKNSNENPTTIKKKILGVDKSMLQKLYNLNIDEDVDEVKLNTPIYYIYDKEYKRKNMYIKFNLSKKFNVQENSIGKEIIIYASYSTYNFNDKENKAIKIRGWKFQIKNILAHRLQKII